MKATTWQRVDLGRGRRAGPVARCASLPSPRSRMSAILPGLPEGLPDLPRSRRNHAAPFAAPASRSAASIRSAIISTARPTPGRPEFEIAASRLVWRFASAANRDAFLAAPEIYAPAFEGFDPTGVADGHAVETSPAQFAIVDGRLFLFRTAARTGSNS